MQFRCKQFEDFLKTVPDIGPIIQRQAHDQIEVQVHFVAHLLNDAFRFFKILLAADFQICFLIHRLDANFKPEQPFWNVFVDEPDDIGMQNVGSDFKLKHIAGTMMLKNELKYFQCKIALHVERTIQKFDHASMCHQVQQVVFDIGHGQVSHVVVQTGQTKFAFIRTAPAGFNVADFIVQIGHRILNVRIDAYEITHIVHHGTFAVHNGALFFKRQIRHLIHLGIAVQKFVKRNFAFTGNDEVDTVQLQNRLPFVTHFRSAQ